MDLIELLESADHLEPGKQHQLYGAIQEISLFLRAIDHLSQKEKNEGLQFTLANGRKLANGNGRKLENPIAEGKDPQTP